MPPCCHPTPSTRVLTARAARAARAAPRCGRDERRGGAAEVAPSSEPLGSAAVVMGSLCVRGEG